MPRQLPAPWRVERIPAGYVVRDANGLALAYVYGRSSEMDARHANVLTEDEAHLVANCIALLPTLLGY
jgi:hypothetical protein